MSVGAFSMDLQDYVAFGTENRQLFSELTNQLETYLVSVPVNSNGSVTGLELVYEQPIGESFGFNANYTYADGKTAHTWADGSNNLVGTSKDTYNVGVYFENEKFSARANYSYRTSFLIGLSGANPYYQDDFGTLSLALNYKPTEWINVSLDALNLNSPDTDLLPERDGPHRVLQQRPPVLSQPPASSSEPGQVLRELRAGARSPSWAAGPSVVQCLRGPESHSCSASGFIVRCYGANEGKQNDRNTFEETGRHVRFVTMAGGLAFLCACSGNSQEKARLCAALSADSRAARQSPVTTVRSRSAPDTLFAFEGAGAGERRARVHRPSSGRRAVSR